MTTGWECPVCYKGCAPQALKCEHCAESKAKRREPTADEMKRAMDKLKERPDPLQPCAPWRRQPQPMPCPVPIPWWSEPLHWERNPLKITCRTS